VGKLAKIDGLVEKMTFGAFMAIFRSKINDYIELFLKSPVYRKSLDNVSTTTINQITQNNLKNTIIPLPPLNEQKRIVAKIESLMALCDKLEAERDERNNKRFAIHRAAMNGLLSTSDSKAFNSSWSFIVRHFDTLHSVPQNVDELKKAILQLAVMGKLVDQDPNDQPASDLLKEIEAEKEKLVKAGKIKKQEIQPPIKTDEIPFELPKGWEWARFGEVAINVDYGSSKKSSRKGDVPVFAMGHIQSARLQFERFKYLNADNDEFPYLLLKKNDILFNRTNSWELVGKSAVFEGDDNRYSFASYLIRLRLIKSNSYFINAVMNSRYFRVTQIETQIVQQCGQANFNGTKLKNTLIPLPPLNEQKRIVEKVDRLMALCNTLEQQLEDSTSKQTAILNAVLARIVV
jgi:type I restriction enzyme S subunit